MTRLLLAAALLGAAALASPAAAVDVVGCVNKHNYVPDPQYGGHQIILDPVGTAGCIVPLPV